MWSSPNPKLTRSHDRGSPDSVAFEVLSGPERRRRWSTERSDRLSRRRLRRALRFVRWPDCGCGPRGDLSVAARSAERCDAVCGSSGCAGSERAIGNGCAGADDRTPPRHSRAHCGDGARGTGNCGYQSFGAAMIGLPTGVRVWIAAGHTDMRRGMQSLALQVQEGLKRDPHAGDLYVFRGRSGSLIKFSPSDDLPYSSAQV
jgi:transposase